MNETAAEWLQILQALDDPVNSEWPPGFDYEAAEGHFLAFASELERALATACRVETGVLIQDASFLGQIILPDSLFTKPRPPGAGLLRVSNWGNLATISHDEVIEPSALGEIKELLRRFGYVYIPSSVLDLPYTGSNAGVTGTKTWWIRYFDWV